MPTTPQAKKSLRQSHKRYIKNEAARRRLQKLVKDLRKAAHAKDAVKAKTLMRDVQKAFDKAVKTGIAKTNTANRTKSRLATLVRTVS